MYVAVAIIVLLIAFFLFPIQAMWAEAIFIGFFGGGCAAAIVIYLLLSAMLDPKLGDNDYGKKMNSIEEAKNLAFIVGALIGVFLAAKYLFNLI